MIENVVVVVADALRRDHVGIYSDTFNDLTPNIDNLASSGISFSNAYTTINTTDPAITSLNTGKYPHSHGIINHADQVTRKEKSRIESQKQLQEILKEQGYYTIKAGRPLGRWHKNGYDSSPNISTSNSLITPLENLWKFTIQPKISSLLRNNTKVATKLSQVYNDIFAEDSSVDVFLEKIDDSPFFGFIHLMDTHTPYEPRSEYIQENLKKLDEDNDMPLEDLVDRFGKGSWIQEMCQQWSVRFSSDSTCQNEIGTNEVRARYMGGVQETDDKVGRLVDGLKEQGVLDKTLLIFLSDHGESLGEHGIFYDHHGLYEPTIRIPLVFFKPDLESRNINDLVQIIDIYPTILEALGVDDTESHDGISLWKTIQGNSENGNIREFIFAEEAHTQRNKMIRSGKYKHIWATGDSLYCRYCGVQHASAKELYDLTDDPQERNDIYENSKDIAAELRELERDIQSSLNEDTGDNEVTYEDEEEIMERLEKLGYR